jgi:AraC-like DNA-binding protein
MVLMKSDSESHRDDDGVADGLDPRGPIARAHLRDPADTSHSMTRLPAPDALAGLVRWFWIPVWSVAPGREVVQAVLRYPVPLIVVTPSYARFYGVEPGLSRTTLAGDGWGFGLTLQPAAGRLLTGGPMSHWRDRTADLGDLLGDAGHDFTRQVRRILEPDPRSPEAHVTAAGAACDLLDPFLPVDDEGALANAVVEWIETTPQARRVEDVTSRFGLSERGLQRLCRDRVGLGAKWIIQRRRLHEAVELLRTRASDPRDAEALVTIAVDLGYADQAHFTRDFRSVTGMTPGRFVDRERG